MHLPDLMLSRRKSRGLALARPPMVRVHAFYERHTVVHIELVVPTRGGRSCLRCGALRTGGGARLWARALVDAGDKAVEGRPEQLVLEAQGATSARLVALGTAQISQAHREPVGGLAGGNRPVALVLKTKEGSESRCMGATIRIECCSRPRGPRRCC